MAVIVVCWSEYCRTLGVEHCHSVLIATQSPEYKMYYDSYNSYSARHFPQLRADKLEIARLAGLAIVLNVGIDLLYW